MTSHKGLLCHVYGSYWTRVMAGLKGKRLRDVTLSGYSKNELKGVTSLVKASSRPDTSLKSTSARAALRLTLPGRRQTPVESLSKFPVRRRVVIPGISPPRYRRRPRAPEFEAQLRCGRGLIETRSNPARIPLKAQ